MYESQIPDIYKNLIIESKNISFFEHVFPYKTYEEGSPSKKAFEPQGRVEEEDEPIEVEIKRSKRARVEKFFRMNFITFMLKIKPKVTKKQ